MIAPSHKIRSLLETLFHFIGMNLKLKRIFHFGFLKLSIFFTNYAIFPKFCKKLRFEVNYAKSQHSRI